MAENPGTKSEHFAWNDGRRIVDLCELSKQLHCKQCSSLLDLQRTEREARYGLVSVLFIPCNCGVMNDVHTGKMQCGGLRNSADPIYHYEVNAKASAHLLMYGADASRILSFLALLDIPLPAPNDPSLTVLVKKDSSDVHCPSHSHPSQMHSSYTSRAVSFSVEPNVSRTCALQTASPPFHTSDTAVTSVPLALPSHQHWDRDNDDDHEDDDNGYDNSDSRSAAADGDLKERKNDMIEIDGTKTDDGRGEHTMSNANRSHKENKEEEDGKDEYVPPMKIRAKAHNSRKIKKPSAEKLRKTQAAVREPLKVVVQKVPRTRAKVKKEELPMETVKKQDRKEQADDKVDFSNTLEWSSTESEVEASQDPDSDASWQMEEEKVKPVKANTIKRGRGRPKGSTDKVKRTRKRGTELKKSGSREEVRAGGVEDGGVPRCTACSKDFNSIKGYNLHMTKMHNQGRHHQDPRSYQEKQNQQGHDEDTDSEVKEPPVIAPERPGQVTQEEEVTAELFRCPRCCSVFSDPKNFFSHASRSHPSLETEEKGKLYPVPLKDSVMKRRVVHEDGKETLSYRCCKCCDAFPSPYVLGKHLCIDRDSQLSCVALCPNGAKIRGKVMELAFQRKLPCLCNICGKVYSNQGILKTHIESVHTVNKLFSCSVCSVSFSRPSSLQSHMETHEANRPRPFVCQTCGKRFYAFPHLRKHERDQHLNSACFMCPVCGKAFSTRRSLDGHKIIHSGLRTYSCSVCFMKFYKKYNLTVHERIHSGVKPYKCSVCPLTFAQQNSLNVHMKKHRQGIKKGSKFSDSKPFDADVTESSFETCRSDDNESVVEMDAANKASVTPRVPAGEGHGGGRRGRRAGVPLWETVKEERVTESLYQCPSCSLLYSQPHCLTVHLRKEHQVDATQVESYGIPLEGSVMKLKRVWKGDKDHVRTCYKCLKCDAIIHHHRKFAQHIRVNTDKQITCEALCPEGDSLRSYQRTLFLKGYKNYLCHTCGASFTERDTFYHHIETHGEMVSKKYMCEFCPYSATRQLRMMNHVMSKHSSEPRPRPHVCEQCGKGFFNKNMLGQHKMDVHIKEKKYKCHLCPKVFLRRHKLTVHIKLHSGVRPFVCNNCGQTFTAAYNLKVHQRLHTGEKPYKCAHCDAAFAQKSSLDVHMKKHGLGPTRQTKMYQTASGGVNTYPPPQTTTAASSPPRVKTPPPLAQPPPPPPSLLPPLRDSAQKVDSSTLHLPPRQPPSPPPMVPMDFLPQQRMDPQQSMEVQPAHPRLDPSSPHPPRMESPEASQHHRMESYMYPGYSGVVFPGVSYPFYPNV